MPSEQALSIMANEVGKAIDPDCFAALRDVVSAGLGMLPLPRTPRGLLPD